MHQEEYATNHEKLADWRRHNSQVDRRLNKSVYLLAARPSGKVSN